MPEVAAATSGASIPPGEETAPAQPATELSRGRFHAPGGTVSKRAVRLGPTTPHTHRYTAWSKHQAVAQSSRATRPTTTSNRHRVWRARDGLIENRRCRGLPPHGVSRSSQGILRLSEAGPLKCHAFHGFRVGVLRRAAAPPVATARRPVGAKSGGRVVSAGLDFSGDGDAGGSSTRCLPWGPLAGAADRRGCLLLARLRLVGASPWLAAATLDAGSRPCGAWLGVSSAGLPPHAGAVGARAWWVLARHWGNLRAGAPSRAG
jgi:hypothetical protein